MRIFFLLLSFSILFSFCKNGKKNSSSAKELPKKEDLESPIIAPTDAFIKKYEGFIGEKSPIELVLINWSNGILGGYYFYKKENQKPKKIELSGELNLNENFELNEFVEDDFTGKFNGNLLDLKTISGIWSNADSSKSMPFTLKEINNIDKKGWSGAWYRNDIHSPGTLILGNVTEKTLDFGLEIFNGGHSGVLEGTANLNGGIATFNSTVFGAEEKCNLIFQIRNNKIRVSQKSSSGACGFGMRAVANGLYENQLKPQKLELSYGEGNKIFKDKTQHDAFAKLVGDDYDSYTTNMQNVSKEKETPADNLGTVVFTGSVTGLGTLNEAIIMRNDKNEFWAATIIFDEMKDDFIVKYHTNVSNMKETLPITIDKWRSRFNEFKIVQ